MKVSGRTPHHLFFHLLVGMTILAAASESALGQSIYGSIRGLITDASAAVVAGAKVNLINEGTGDQRSVSSNNLGEYVFSQAIPGTYTIAVEAPGFKKLERKGVVLETQGNVTVDLSLQVGNVTESVVVEEMTPLIETATASQGQVIDHQKLIDLPNIGRNPFMMSKLAPNVQQVGNPAYMRMQDQSGSSQISFAGFCLQKNNYLLDGRPVTDTNNRGTLIPSRETGKG